MKFDKNKAFPYPVLRPGSDDYVDGEFQATVDFSIKGGFITAKVNFALSSEEIQDQIKLGNAEYVCVIACRDTYKQEIISSRDGVGSVEFDSGSLKGEVRIDPYVVVRKQIAGYTSEDINLEFGPGPFSYDVGDVLAQDETQCIYIDRDLFKPITSVFDMVKKDGLSDGMWTINFEDDHIQIEVNQRMKESIDDARNDFKNRIILLNSVYFAAVMQAVQYLQNPQEGAYEGKKWAEVIKKQAQNNGIDLATHDAYYIAEQLMQLPMLQLDKQVFKGVSE